jgi:hypothetical protein
MQTLRRELRNKFEEVLRNYSDKLTIAEREAVCELLADAALELRAFKTDEDRPAYGVDWIISHGLDVTQQDLDKAKKQAAIAPNKFEAALGFGSLPWYTTNVWTRFAKFVTEIYNADPLAFGNYLVWRASDAGKYKAMSNKQIRLNPQAFMDTGWFDFTGEQTESEDIFAAAREEVENE